MMNEDEPTPALSPCAPDYVDSVKKAAFPGLVAAILVKCVMYSLGFESGGIRGRSYAATWMSFADKYGIGKGIVSFLQSCGTGGICMYLGIFLVATLLFGEVLRRRTRNGHHLRKD